MNFKISLIELARILVGNVWNRTGAALALVGATALTGWIDQLVAHVVGFDLKQADQWVGFIILGLGVWMLWHAKAWPKNSTKVTERPIASVEDRIPITELREWAVAAGWCSDVRAATVGDNDWWTFLTKLRQAAADGDIRFWGRRFIYDYGKEADAEPLTEIPRSHFVEYTFDVVELAQADNYDIFTGKIGHRPRELKGNIFRDLNVDSAQSRAWLAGKGAPPPAAELVAKLNSGAAKIGAYLSVCAITIQNVSSKELDSCLVQVEQFSGPTPKEMPMPLVLRTEGQIRNSRSGRFTLSAGQPKTVPVIFRDPIRKNEWCFFDEAGTRYMLPAGPTKIVLGVYGGSRPGKALVSIDTDAGWEPYPSVKIVADDYRIW